jgi:DNA-binding Lrp family transcriptional regulator
MSPRSSVRPPSAAVPSNDLRSRPSGLEFAAAAPAPLDEVDRVLVAELSADARLPNNELASRAGIAPSTCLARVRRLREAGILRGFHADVDPALAGRPIQAMIAVRVQGQARTRLAEFQQYLLRQPGVLEVYLLGGAHDFFVHVAAPSTWSLNEFVIEHLSGNPDVALSETNLIFQHGRAPRYH